MKRVGILLIGMMLLAIVSAATAQGNLFVSASGVGDTGGNGDFEKFWGILGNVSALVVEVNSSPNYNNVHDLIRWTRLGEENAGNISALVWKSLLDLKSSGVKLHYTSEELRSLASNISRNGLPSETVQALKEQGWSDDQINALVSYIRDHSNDIVGDFDLGAYLEAFSDSFIEVGKKYASYETWAFEKYYWHNALSNPPSGNVVSNPYVSAYDVSKLDYAASTKNADGLLSTVKSLRDDIEFVITDVAIAYYTNGGVKFQTTSLSSSGKTIKTYYWANALKAYRLVSELYTIAVALKNGNSNEDLWDLVRQYKRELDSILAVKLVSTTFIPAPRPGPSPMPIPLSLDSFSPASYTPGDEPRLVITDVKVIKTDADFIKGLVKYRVRVDYYVYGGAVMIDRVKFNDGSESKVLSMDAIVYTGPGSVESPEFIAPVGNALQASVSGIVKIRYRSVTSPGGDTPNSKPGDPVETTSVQAYTPADYSTPTAPVLVMESYHGTLDLISDIDLSKITVKTIANTTKVTEGQSVGFAVRLRNDNSKAVNGVLSLFVTVPEENSERLVLLGRKTVTLNPDENVVIQVGNVTYPQAGTYEYFATFSFKGMEVKDSGSVEVRRLVLQKNLAIKSLQISPINPEEHDDVDIIVYPYYVFRLVPESNVESSVFKNNFGPDALVPVSLNSEQGNIELSVVVSDVKTSDIVFGDSIEISPENIRPFYVSHWRNAKAGDFEVTVGLISGTEVIDSKTVRLHINEGDGYTGRFLTGESQAHNLTVTQGTFMNITLAADYYGELKNEYVPVKVWYLYDSPSEGIHWTSPIRVFEKDIKFDNVPPTYVEGQYAQEFRGWFGFHFDNPGVYHFYLYVNGEFEDFLTVNVTFDGPVLAWMECKSPVRVDSSTTCSIHIKNYNPIPVSVSLKEVYFAEIPIWKGVDDDSVQIPINSKKTVVVPANAETDRIAFEITFNSNLAEKLFGDSADYFLSPGGGYYKYLLTPGGQPTAYRIAAKLSTGQRITYDICLLPDTPKITGYELAGGVLSGLSLILAISQPGLGTFVTIGGFVLTLYPSIRAPSPVGSSERDNNLIGGDASE